MPPRSHTSSTTRTRTKPSRDVAAASAGTARKPLEHIDDAIVVTDPVNLLPKPSTRDRLAVCAEEAVTDSHDRVDSEDMKAAIWRPGSHVLLLRFI